MPRVDEEGPRDRPPPAADVEGRGGSPRTGAADGDHTSTTSATRTEVPSNVLLLPRSSFRRSADRRASRTRDREDTWSGATSLTSLTSSTSITSSEAVAAPPVAAAVDDGGRGAQQGSAHRSSTNSRTPQAGTVQASHAPSGPLPSQTPPAAVEEGGSADATHERESIPQRGIVRLLVDGANEPVAPADTPDVLSAAEAAPPGPSHAGAPSMPRARVEVRTRRRNGGEATEPPPDGTPRNQAVEPADSEAGSDTHVINIDLHVTVASIKSILGHYFGLFLLLLVPAILLLIGTILPFWLQHVDVVVRYDTVFPYFYTEQGRNMYDRFAGFAPCLMLKYWYCSVATGRGQRGVTQEWMSVTAQYLQPILGRMGMRRSFYVADSCVPNGTSPFTGYPADIVITSHNAKAPRGAEVTFAMNCTSDTNLAPMVNVTTTLVSLDEFGAVLPTAAGGTGPSKVSGAALLAASLQWQHQYDRSLSSCDAFLERCDIFGLRYIWIPSPGNTEMGYVHWCVANDNSTTNRSSSRQGTESGGVTDGRRGGNSPSPSSGMAQHGLPFVAGPTSQRFPDVARFMGRNLSSGDYTTILVCEETVYEVETAYNENVRALSMESSVKMNFYGQLGGIRFVGLEVLSSMGLILPVIIFIVTEVLLAFSALMIIMVGYTLPVQRFQLHQLRTAIVIDANILADAITERTASGVEQQPQQTQRGATPSSPASPETPATAEETFASRQDTTATVTTSGGALGDTAVPRDRGASASVTANERGTGEDVEMEQWPYGRGEYLSHGSTEEPSPALQGVPGVGEEVVFSPAEAPTPTSSSGARGVSAPSSSSPGTSRRRRASLHLTVTVSSPLSRAATLTSPETPARIAEDEGGTTPIATAPSMTTPTGVSPTTPPTGGARRPRRSNTSPTRQSSGQSGGATMSTSTSPLVAISNATMRRDASDTVGPASPTELGLVPSYEAVAKAARETMLHERANQAKVIRAILFIQQASILLAFVFAVVGLVFVLAGVGNPVGRPCDFDDFGEYPYCTYSRRPRAQHITLTALALFCMLVLIAFQYMIIRKQVW